MFNLKIILRNLRRNGLYSVINIGGLAIGITASVFILMWVYHERSYDRYHSAADRIYRIDNVQFAYETGQTEKIAASPYNLPLMVRDFPEVENVASKVSATIELGVGDAINGIKVNNDVFAVARRTAFIDQSWFDVFDYTLLEGSLNAFADHPNSIVLTRSESRKYFGKTPATGQTVSINHTDYIVQAVVADNPSNSSFQWDVFVPLDAYSMTQRIKSMNTWIGMYFGTVFVKLRPDANIAAVTQKINDIYTANEYKATASLTPLSQIYFDTESLYPGSDVRGNIKMVTLFGVLGVLLMLTACFNYINLTTAKANARTKEVGVKKIVGAKRRELIMQFIAESFVLCLIAILFSLILICLFSPFYHFLAGNAVFTLSSSVLWIILTVILFATTLLNGIYPAFMLSSFRPMNFLKGIGALKIKAGNLRRGLVVFQFALSTTLIICVMIISAQMRYIRQKDPGYNRENVISLKGPNIFSTENYSSIQQKLQTVCKELQSEPAIISASLCSHEITDVRSFGYDKFDWDGKPADFRLFIHTMSVDHPYQNTLGLQMVEGRWFEEGSRSDANNVIFNETAIRTLGIREPYIGQRFDLPLDEQRYRIIGIVKDFHFRSLHEPIEPLALFVDESMRNIISFKTHPGQTTQALKSAKTVWTTHFPNDPFDYAFLDDSFHNLYQSEIKTSRLMLLFGALAIFIALMGLFGLSTFAVERRIKEISIRKVMGASISNIVSLLSKEFLILVGVALLIAFPVAYYWADKILQDYAYRIRIDWWFFALAGVITVALTLLTIGWQAIKAAIANPVDAIKTE